MTDADKTTDGRLLKDLNHLKDYPDGSHEVKTALLDSEQRLTDIINFLPDATFAIDLEGRVMIWNKAMEVMSGASAASMIGKGNYEYSLPFYQTRRPLLIDLVFASDDQIKGEYHFVQKMNDILLAEVDVTVNGKGVKHLWGKAGPLYDSRGNIIGAIETIRDITEHKVAEKERKRLQDHLQRVEKMEALGNLAAGVAHDLNNVIGVIVGYAELIIHEADSDDPMKPRLAHVLKSGNRAAAIVQDLLTLARRGVYVREIFNLNDIVNDFFDSPEFLRLCSYHPRVHIEKALNPDLMNIIGSPVHFEKTLFNLVCNAAEAMPEGGELVISTNNRFLENPVDGYDQVNPGDYAVLTVFDTGDGISGKDMTHIFEPFYTKKVMGRSGTGLGLAVVWSTVKDHYGYIAVESIPEQGSVFNLYIPATRKPIGKSGARHDLSIYESSKGERILVIDDVMEQGMLAVEILANLKYSALHVSSGEAGLEHLKKHNTDLIILDMIMDPGMDGLDTYIEILRINPEQKVIIVSGFAETERASRALKLGAGAFIKKPYAIEQLGKAVRETLDRIEK